MFYSLEAQVMSGNEGDNRLHDFEVLFGNKIVQW